jgi:hypothetical protein
MASFTKYEPTTQQFWTGTHNLTAAGNVVKVALHTDAPTVATDDELADLTQVTGTGYTAGGIDIANDISRSGGTTTLTGTDQTWTATAGDWIAARYVVIHDDTSTTDKLLGDWDYGGNFTLANGETFTVDFGASVATLV